ncbi:hypothetical protein BKP45_03925 [Anaerobacillus alkalidiazotrophicus]|uniref:Uncharacterized protein n=1 Tax=Anaerobacillus alkalidiazotrophicus TaxID=472963 RepID=A0A1S2MAQ1_9BACI|nr:hypothetical protein [Anaerobacillus alkalidiazotrophicus]OIJ21852.1 hypothetical protein BKP45_03925 [Anaerobacillus alkalidiazotrophicus]
MKKQKKAGDNISLKTKKTEAEEILNWINSQSNLMDSIRYLIENEIRENGVRNLQNFIPANRDISGINFSNVNNEAANPVVNSEIAATLEEQTPIPPSSNAEQTDITNEEEKNKAETEEDIDDEDIESWL